MPVPCKRDFGLADDAATAAKRMQNGAAGEANFSDTLNHQAAVGRADGRNHFGRLRATVAGRTAVHFRQSPQALVTACPACQLPRQHLSFRVMPAVMFNSQATNMPQCCAMSDLVRSIKGAHDVQARGLP